jgi:hypothetical protein
VGDDATQGGTTAQKAAIAVGYLAEERAAARQRMLSGKGDPSKLVGQGAAAKGPNPSKHVGRGTAKHRPDEAVERAGRRAGVSGQTVRQAEHIANTAPDVFAAMQAGVLDAFADARRLALLPPDVRKPALTLIADGASAKEAMLKTSGSDELPSLKKPVQEWVLIQRAGRLLDEVQSLPDGDRHRCLEAIKMMVETKLGELTSGVTTTHKLPQPQSEPDTDELDGFLDDPSLDEPSSGLIAELNYEFTGGFDAAVASAAYGFLVPFRSTDIAKRLRCSHQKVSGVLRRLGWPRNANTLLRDGRRGPRWLPQCVDPTIVEDYDFSNGREEVHEDDQRRTWSRRGHTVKK